MKAFVTPRSDERRRRGEQRRVDRAARRTNHRRRLDDDAVGARDRRSERTADRAVFVRRDRDLVDRRATRGHARCTERDGAGGGRAARRHRDVDDAAGFEDEPGECRVVRRVAGHAEHDVAALRFGAVRRRARGRRVREQPRRRAERDPAAVGRTRVGREEFDASALRTGRVDRPVDVDAAVVGRETHAVRAERRIREQREIAFAHAHRHRVGEAARLETRGERGEIGKAQRVEREAPVARRDGRRARRCAPQRAVELHAARHGGHDELSGVRTGCGHVDDAVSVGPHAAERGCEPHDAGRRGDRHGVEGLRESGRLEAAAGEEFDRPDDRAVAIERVCTASPGA
jgi:hypothetical protein